MPVQLQIRLNGGAPQTGGVTGAIGNAVQLTAANKSTWNGAARWEIYDYPPSFTVPAGWAADGDGVFYALGNSDPPAFTISGSTNWGKYGFRVTVLDGSVLTTDDATALSIPSAGGLRSIMAGESSQFGGTRQAWVKDLKADIRALASGGGSGTVTPDADELVLRDGTGKALATAFRGPSGAAAVLESQATRDVHLDSANDVLIDVGAEADAVRVQVAGATAMTITPTASNITLATTARTLNLETTGAQNIAITSGRDAVISHAASRSTLIREGGTDVASFTAASIVHTVGTVAATCTDSIGTFLCATNAPMRIQPQQAASGAGRALTIGGGAGQTPGTHAPGNTIVDLGTPVAAVVAKCSFITSAGELGAIDAGFTDYCRITGGRTNGGLLLYGTGSGGSVSVVGNVNVTLQGQAATGHVTSVAASHRWQNASSVEFERWVPGSATIASATTTNVVTFATTANRVYHCIGAITVSNDTDDQGAAYWVRAAFKRVGGTVTQIGSTQTIAADLEDAGQTGLSAVLDFSGTDIRLRLVTDAADTVNVNGKLEILERVLA